MKLKRFIISFSLVLLAFVGTACGVVYSHYYNYSKEIKKGDYFFMPACLMDTYLLTGNVEVIECY